MAKAKTLKEAFAATIPRIQKERLNLLKKHGDTQISTVSMIQAYGGMRGIKGMVCDTSVVEPDKGLIIRGTPIMKLKDRLPEEIFWLLFIGKLPTPAELKGLQKQLRDYGKVPDYVWKVLRAMPKTSHPMTMLDTAILAMQHESQFAKRYAEGVAKKDYWDPTYEDAIKLIAVIPTIAAGVYRIRYKKGALIKPNPRLDWAANFVHMLGLDTKKGETHKMMRLYLTLHCDHEGGNVSANTCHTVGSALSDPFYAVSAGLNGLAGPLHGLANQECLKWVLETIDKFGGVPSKKQLEQYTWDTLNSGKVVPGYGHAVLRVTDPRFSAFLAHGKKYLKSDDVFQTVARVYDVVPTVLKQIKKIQNPWPNVDAGSGGILFHYGITEFQYYTVLFSVSRAMGMVSQQVINRALGTPITRPKSISAKWLKVQVKGN
jgi:citrate synthase